MRRLLLVILGCLLILPLFASQAEHPAQKSAETHATATEGAEAAHAESGEAHPEKKILGIPEWVWKLANLIIFWGLIGYLVIGPVRKGLTARSDKIRQDIAGANERRLKADQFASQVDERLKKLEDEVAAIIERARVDGERQRTEMIASAEAEAAKILTSARNEIDARVKQARKELTEYAGDLAADRARRILEETITDADRHRLFDESVRQIREVKS